jgi:histidine ammonia-lyase
MQTVTIDGEYLNVEQIVAVARHGAEVALAPNAREAIQTSRDWVEEIIQKGNPVYGINTGFGCFAEQRIKPEESAQLSRNLILSHAVGVGTPLSAETVRAAMLVRANTLSKGHSGVRVEVVEILLALLNKGVTPLVPSQGSLGSSGDLAPLSHMAQVFSTDGRDLDSESGSALYQGVILSGKGAMARAGIDRIILEAKEGLALSNGATFSAAIAALALYDAETLLRAGEVSLALSLEALMGCSAAFDNRIHHARGLQGQLRVAEAVRRLTHGSNLLDQCNLVQDAYSLRCAPQVQGIGWDTMTFAGQVIEAEVNAATDNPLLFTPGIALSGGNFHGEPVGLVMDYLGIALAELAAISERRTYRLVDSHFNAGLPPMLVDSPADAGLNSGLMMPQYTAASLVLENRTLASPDSVQSLPVSALQEDHNANAMTAARHTSEIIANTAQVLAIEVYTAARALDLRLRQHPQGKLGGGTAQAYKIVRDRVPYQSGDAWWGPEIEQVRELILSRALECSAFS